MLLLSNMEKRIFIGICCSIIGICYLWQQWKPISTTIYFMDVGQGDGAVIVSPEHKIAIIDTGGLKSLDTGSRIMTPFLHSLGKRKVDVFIPSHSDYDHIGGGIGLARNIKLEKVVLPKEKFSEDGLQLMNDILKFVKSENVEFARQGKELRPGESPRACFALCEGEELQEVYAYCNIHGLWKAVANQCC